VIKPRRRCCVPLLDSEARSHRRLCKRFGQLKASLGNCGKLCRRCRYMATKLHQWPWFCRGFDIAKLAAAAI